MNLLGEDLLPRAAFTGKQQRNVRRGDLCNHPLDGIHRRAGGASQEEAIVSGAGYKFNESRSVHRWIESACLVFALVESWERAPLGRAKDVPCGDWELNLI